jgi:hypothetical protein
VSLGDLLVGVYLVLVIVFLARQWSQSPTVDEVEPSFEPAEQESRKAA